MINPKKCKLSKKQIRDAFKYGIGVELEHTNSRKKAYNISLQHECEMPKGKVYYGGKKGFLKWEKMAGK